MGIECAPSASLQAIQSWKECLMYQMLVLPSRGTSTGWRNGPTGNSWSSTRGNAEPCSWRWTTPCTRLCWGLTRWKAALQKNILISLEDSKLNTHQHYALAAKMVNSFLGCIRKTFASKSREMILLCPALVRNIWCAGSSPGLPVQEPCTYWCKSSKEPSRCWRNCSPVVWKLVFFDFYSVLSQFVAGWCCQLHGDPHDFKTISSTAPGWSLTNSSLDSWFPIQTSEIPWWQEGQQ